MRKLILPAAASLSVFSCATTAYADDILGIGLDAQFVMPLGDFADATGPEIGPLLRGGIRLVPPLELTARVGFLYGLSSSHESTQSTPITSPTVITVNEKRSVDDIPVWLGARWFFMDAPGGLYAALELGMNVLRAHAGLEPATTITNPTAATSASGSTTSTREGLNLGVGYVLSRHLPLDVRAQFSMLNLVGKESGESTLYAAGLSVGYTFFFL